MQYVFVKRLRSQKRKLRRLFLCYLVYNCSMHCFIILKWSGSFNSWKKIRFSMRPFNISKNKVAVLESSLREKCPAVAFDDTLWSFGSQQLWLILNNGTILNLDFKIFQWLFGTKYSRMDQVKFVEDSLKKFEGIIVCLRRPYHFKTFKGCLPQISIGPFLNTLSHLLC